MQPTNTRHALNCRGSDFLLCTWLLVAVLLVLFYRTLQPGRVQFANDVPLGGWVAEFNQMPDALTGVWSDLNWLGAEVPPPAPGVSALLRTVAPPVLFAKIYTPFTMLMLGLCAWAFFASQGLSRSACILGALAAALNSGFFSAACWGVNPHVIAMGWNMLALTALSHLNNPRHAWIRLILAGVCVGMGISEGFDVGALSSLLVAAYAAYTTWLEPGAFWQRFLKALGRVSLVACAAFLVSIQVVSSLVATQIHGVVEMDQDKESAQARWDWATQWSLPKQEVLSLAVPGLFGYRMDTPAGGNYWGQIGRQPGWEQHRQGFARYTGGGLFVGILVLVVAVWAFARSLHSEPPASQGWDRRFVWFWGVVCIVTVLLSLGRHAPFYKLAYALPFFSTIRNPIKFLYIANWAIVVLFAYGISGMAEGYTTRVGQALARKYASKRLSVFDRRWIAGSAAVFVCSALAWLVFARSRGNLEAYLVGEAIDRDLASAVAEFSVRQAGAFVILFGLALTLVTILVAGFFQGPKARWASFALGVFLVFDLGRANQAWILPVNYGQKYASNAVIDFLRNEPYEHRVTALPFPTPAESSLLEQLYRIEWLQHHFPFNDIQSLDIIQMPRTAADVAAYEAAFRPDPSQPASIIRVPRRWTLTNTRYLLGPAGFVDALNTQLAGVEGQFRIAMAFNIVPKPSIGNARNLEDLTAVPSPTGRYAVIEFTGALPRAGLYTQWQVETNDAVTLKTIASRDFDPHQTVLVAQDIGAPAANTPSNTAVAPVEFVSYAPKTLVLRAKAEAPCVLLLNDRYDSDWTVTVDGQPAELLRCNSIMRGVRVEPGEHTVQFIFRPRLTGLYISLATLGLAAVLLCLLLLTGRSVPPSTKPAVAIKTPSRERQTPRKT